MIKKSYKYYFKVISENQAKSRILTLQKNVLYA